MGKGAGMGSLSTRVIGEASGGQGEGRTTPLRFILILAADAQHSVPAVANFAGWA